MYYNIDNLNDTSYQFLYLIKTNNKQKIIDKTYSNYLEANTYFMDTNWKYLEIFTIIFPKKIGPLKGEKLKDEVLKSAKVLNDY